MVKLSESEWYHIRLTTRTALVYARNIKCEDPLMEDLKRKLEEINEQLKMLNEVR